MTSPILPDHAFLPKRPLNEHERRTFLSHRNRMFSLCTRAEQQLLSELALWYSTVRLELLATPNLFSESELACFQYRYFSSAYPKPHPFVFGLSKVHRATRKLERWLGQRAQSQLSRRIKTLIDGDDADALVAVILFLRTLPPEFGPVEKSLIEGELDALLNASLHNRRVSTVRRFDALVRCAKWSYDENEYVMHDVGLRKHAWPLLLELAEIDTAAAIRLIDEHWNQTRPPQILMTLHLHERPELAYKLATRLKPHRTDFAADMLCALISDASYQVKKLDQAAAEVLASIIDSSCKLLAEWMFEGSWTTSQIALRSLGHLLQYGDPQANYWLKLAPETLAVLKTLPVKELDQQLRLLAALAFYSGNPQLISEASELFDGCVGRRLDIQGDWDWVVTPAIFDVSQSLSILENKVMCMRNRHIKANPSHPLLRLVDAQFQAFLARLLTTEPACALRNLVSLTLALSNETLIRKHHRILRDEFAVRAHEHPIDAGLALKKLIEHCGYSQTDDEMYCKELCQESFDALLPVLESISTADATVARTGIGWNPRWNI